MKLYTMHTRLFTRGLLLPRHEAMIRAMDAHVFALSAPSDELEASLGDHYHRHPFADNKVPQNVWDIVQEVLKVWNAGHPVIVHCRAGRNRSTFIAGLTLRQITGWTGPQVMDHVRHVRPNALANPHFEAYLESLT